MQVSVHAIVVTWNSSGDILECLRCLSSSERISLNLIVVDNGSRDGTPRLVADYYPDVTLVQNEENLGFTQGNNIGIRLALSAGADFVFLINADAFVTENTLTLLTRAAQGEPRVGLIGPAVVSYYDRTKVYCGGRVDLTLVQPYEELNVPHDKLFDTDYVPGCAVLASAPVIRQIGLFDEAYLSYWEDTDWSVRCRMAGLRTVIEPNATLVHKGTLDRVLCKSDFSSYLYTRNRFLFASKFKPRGEMPAFAREYTRDVCKQIIQMDQSEPAKVDAVINGWWAGITRHYGSQFISAPESVLKLFKRNPRRFLDLMYPVNTLRARVPVRSTLRRMRGKS